MLEFLKLLKEKKKISEEKENKEDNNYSFYSEYINFKIGVDRGFGLCMGLTYNIYTLDDEDLAYFKNKFCKNLEKEKKEKLAEIEKEYDNVKC